MTEGLGSIGVMGMKIKRTETVVPDKERSIPSEVVDERVRQMEIKHDLLQLSSRRFRATRTIRHKVYSKLWLVRTQLLLPM